MTTTATTASKNVFAKVLATENIIVRHDSSAETASFDLNTRVLTLPMWKNMSDSLYDMLIGHEVSHALFTPHMTPTSFAALMAKISNNGDLALARNILNVVEDSRIERKIKEMYPGLRRDFYNGYKSILEMDLFGIQNKDVNDLPFIDRLNLFTKVGFIMIDEIEFAPEELQFINETISIESFESVVDLSKRIYEFIRIEQEQQEQEQQQDKKKTAGSGDGDGQQTQSGMVGDESSSNQNTPDQGTTTGDNGNQGTSNSSSNDPSSRGEKNETIQERLDRALQEMAQHNGSTTVMTIPTPILDKIITPYKDLISFWETGNRREMAENNYHNYFERLDAHVDYVIDSSKRTVNTMVQQFERKKAAEQSRRARVSKTGVINVDRLHQYKFSDDIFNSRLTVRDHKNHGFVIFLDWSGSMSGILHDTVLQAIQICLFCRAAKIPFELYGFSTSNLNHYAKDGIYEYQFDSFTYTDTDFHLDDLGLLNFLSSKMNKHDFRKGLQILLQASTNSVPLKNRAAMKIPRLGLSMPKGLTLGGTPLNAAIICANEIVNRFKHENKIEVTNSVFLTDGESDSISLCKSKVGGSIFIQDRKTGHSFPIENFSSSVTEGLIRLHKIATGANTIRFHLDTVRTINWGNYLLFANCPADKMEKLQDCYNKENFCLAYNSLGFDELYMVRSDVNVDFGTNDDKILEDKKKSFASLKNAFVKVNLNKITSRTLLTRFIELISR
jgi:hypothetical protein